MNISELPRDSVSSETKCEAIVVEMIFILTRIKLIFSTHRAVTLSRWPCLLHPSTPVGRGHCSKRVGDVGPDVMVYLTCAVIGLGGRGVIITWTEVAARVRLHMLMSDLTSLVPPQFSHWLQVREVGTVYILYKKGLLLRFVLKVSSFGTRK